jgi:hypothetical protein
MYLLTHQLFNNIVCLLPISSDGARLGFSHILAMAMVWISPTFTGTVQYTGESN